VTLHPDVPGRGAWTRAGGLLPLKPGGEGPGYYRPPHAGEAMVGSAYASGRDTSHTARVVHLGVKAVQRLVGVTRDGVFGDVTGAGIAKAQKRLGLKVDAIAGPVTLRGLLEVRVFSVAAEFDVPIDVLGGVSLFESGLDPAAVGVSGWDHGIDQINLAAHDVRLEDALDPGFALVWTAKDLRAVHDRWVGKTTADPFDIAVANHNSPLLARVWAESGAPPFSQDRQDHGFPQIETYVRKARASW
jgi:hypothetical protein